MERTSKIYWAQAILIVLGLIVFAQILGFDFVNLDDPAHLNNNPYLNGAKSPLDLWEKPYKRLYIPITYTLWGFLYSTPPDPFRFHLANLFLHLVTVVCFVFPLLRFFSRHTMAALFGSALFAIHPLQVEAVTWVSGLKDVLSGFFAFGCLYFYMKASTRDPHTPERRLFFSAASFFFILAVLAKPSAVILPMITLILFWPRLPNVTLSFSTPFRENIALLYKNYKIALEMLLWVVASLPIVAITWESQSTKQLLFSPPNWIQRPLIALDAIGFYIVKLLAPFSLSVDYGRTPETALSSPTMPLFICLTIALFACAFWGLKKHRAGTAARLLTIFVISILPVLGLKPFVYQTTSTVSDRYLYIAMLSPALGAALLFARFESSRWALRLGATVTAIFLVLSVQQARTWQNSFRLFKHTVKVNPNSWLAYNNLASAYETIGDLPTAIKYYEKSVAIHPHVPGFNSIGILYLQQGKAYEAVMALNRAVDAGFADARIFNNLGTAWMELKEWRKAEFSYRRALQLQPNLPITHQNLRRLHAQRRGE